MNLHIYSRSTNEYFKLIVCSRDEGKRARVKSTYVRIQKDHELNSC